jgi:hypothetical protein
MDWTDKLDGRFCEFQHFLLCGIAPEMNTNPTDRDAVL